MNGEFCEEAEVLAACSRQFSFPSTYLVLDLETTGFSKANDFIVDVGWAEVKDNRVVRYDSALLNWALMPGVDCNRIRSQLERQAADYAKQGRPHYYSWERLCAEGRHPLEVLHAYVSMIYEHIKDPACQVVGHGLWRFDREFIDGHTQRFMQGYLLPWQQHTIIDTGLIEKAAQMAAVPWVGDTLDDWLRRVNNAHSKVKWNLGEHCVQKYRLADRYGVDMQLMHTAGFDCVLSFYLLDTYRQLMEILRGERQVLDGQARV